MNSNNLLQIPPGSKVSNDFINMALNNINNNINSAAEVCAVIKKVKEGQPITMIDLMCFAQFTVNNMGVWDINSHCLEAMEDPDLANWMDMNGYHDDLFMDIEPDKKITLNPNPTFNIKVEQHIDFEKILT